MKFLWGREDEEKRKEDRRTIEFDFFFFEHILKISAHSLFGAWSFFLIRIWFTPSEGSKGFVNWFF
jgi:hypothetical protein